MIGVVVRQKPTFPAEVSRQLASLGVATVHEAQGRTGLMQPHIRPIGAGARIAGPAVTVLVPPGDNWMVHVAIEQCAPGDVVVIGCQTDCTDAMCGDLLATSMRARGVVGLVTDTGVRDVETLRAMAFPVWSRAIHARGTVKATLGSVNLPIVCAGVLVRPGDAIVADDDGVVVVRHADVDLVIGRGEERIRKEEDKRARLAAGELGLDLDNMRGALLERGLRYVDRLDEI